MANLRSITARWYEVTVVVERIGDDGAEKKVKEVYVADSLSVTEAETRVIDEVGQCTPDVIKVQLLPANEFVFDASDKADIWYKVKVQFKDYDYKGKERKTSQYLYVQAGNLETARENVDSIFNHTMLDYSIVSISETNVIEVYEHNVEDK